MNKEIKKAFFEWRGLSPRLAQHFSGDYQIQDSKAMQMARVWYNLPESEPKSQCLTYLGTTGVGKSFAAGWIVAQPDIAEQPNLRFRKEQYDDMDVHEVERRATFIRATKLKRMIMDFQFGKSSEHGWGIETFLAGDVLVIDELGYESLDPNGAYISGLFEFISYRIDSFQRTVITSNLDPDQMEARYGGALWDRLKTYGPIVELDESDYLRN